MRRKLFAGLFFMLGLTAVSAQINLSFNPEKGAKYEYQTEMIQNIKQSVMGQEIPVEMEVNMSYLMEIKDKTPQETHVQLTYQDIVYVISNPMMNMRYDSENPAVRNLINKSFLMVVAPDGSVKSVTEIDNVAESPTNTSGANWQVDAQVVAQLNQQFSGDAVKDMLEQSFKMYPANAVRAGDSWNMDNTTTINNMNTSVKTKYTLKEISGNIATVAIESDMVMTVGAGMEGTIAGTQTGTMTIDTRTGLPVTSDIAQNIAGLVKAQGMDVQVQLTGKVKTSIKEIK